MFNMSKKAMMAEAMMPKKRSMMKTSMMVAGATMAGVGAYASYKAIKNKMGSNMGYYDNCYSEYNDGSYYNDANFDYGPQNYGSNMSRDNEYEELKNKVNEFNNCHKLGGNGHHHDHKGHKHNCNHHHKDKATHDKESQGYNYTIEAAAANVKSMPSNMENKSEDKAKK